MPGVEAFFRRYPLIRHAVKKSAKNFRDNILLACERLFEDWEHIGNVFFPDNKPIKLTKIKPSGSDTHKGGKQVLFLTFQLVNHQTGQLVYKPSDVEMDYRLVGNTDRTRNNYDLGELLSLTELVNKYIRLTGDIQLPTYRILPRSPGSKLTTLWINGKETLPIEKSYGYIEFLSHNPKHREEDGKPAEWDGHPGDWVTNNEEDVGRFYCQLGGFMAISSVFSLCDIHHENIIVHDRQPYLIDQENSFAKPIKGLDGCLMLGLVKKDVADRDKPDIPQDRKITMPLQNPIMRGYSRKKRTMNRIWISNSVGQSQLAEPTRYVHCIAAGFAIVLKTLKDHRLEILSWLNGVKDCVARSVIFPTTEYYKQLDWVYFDVKAADPYTTSYEGEEWFTVWKNQALRNYEKVYSNLELDKDLSETYGGWPAIKDANGRYTAAAPIYVLQQQDNDFFDYINCDIPSYYHRLNSQDLLNARGEKVDIATGAPEHAPGRNTYFPESTWTIISRQLEELGNDQSFSERCSECQRKLQGFLSNHEIPSLE
jgi:hypothetical protein